MNKLKIMKKTIEEMKKLNLDDLKKAINSSKDEMACALILNPRYMMLVDGLDELIYLMTALQYPDALKITPKDRLTEELCMEVVSCHEAGIMYVPKDVQTEEMCLKALVNDQYNFQYCEVKTLKVCIEALQSEELQYNSNIRNMSDDIISQMIEGGYVIAHHLLMERSLRNIMGERAISSLSINILESQIKEYLNQEKKVPDRSESYINLWESLKNNSNYLSNAGVLLDKLQKA